MELVAQVKKYSNALTKCLSSFGKENEPIEVICLLGKPLKESKEPGNIEFIKDQLASVNARIMMYNTVINDSLKSYQEYLDKRKDLSELRQIIDSL